MSIYKIAQVTGFSPSVVARALNQNGYCDEEKRKRVLEVAKEMNYHPNQAARALRSNKTQKIIFCIPDICNPFYFKMIEGVNDVLEKSGYYVMLFPTYKSLERELKMIDLYNSHFYDGIIFVSFNFCNKNIDAVRNANVPTVITNRYEKQNDIDLFDYVYVDHTHGMELAVNHLFEKGCKNIVLITGNLKEQTSFERYQGYENVFKQRNIEINKDYILDGKYNTEESYTVFSKFVKSGKPVDGVVATNDLAAVGVVRYCNENGIKIPENIKLVSFDNTDYAVTMTPSLTSIDMKQYEIGKNAAELLLDRLNGRNKVKNITLDPSLIVRNSTL